ncbi:MAG: hypothetical protein O7C56_03895, partial [Rickettsia endosymbiont of Ixodes persulcatus]|nr:hypothetical protein [Rickettsia endosymbiont of Ixodes persulcatus]
LLAFLNLMRMVCATAVLGYRISMLITGAGALYLAEITRNNFFVIAIRGVVVQCNLLLNYR